MNRRQDVPTRENGRDQWLAAFELSITLDVAREAICIAWLGDVRGCEKNGGRSLIENLCDV